MQSALLKHQVLSAAKNQLVWQPASNLFFCWWIEVIILQDLSKLLFVVRIIILQYNSETFCVQILFSSS